jgi:hypothetical protein
MRIRNFFLLGLALVLVGLSVPLTSSFAWVPARQWLWHGEAGSDAVSCVPIVVNLTDDNENGVIDACDIPEVAFITNTGKLIVVDGSTGEERFVMDEDLAPVGLAAADLVGNSVPELIAIKYHDATDSFRIVAFDTTETQVVTGDLVPGDTSCAKYLTISVADLSGDGIPEILVGAKVFEGNTGELLWEGAGGQGRFQKPACSRSSTGVDLNMDDTLEVLAGNTAYRWDGDILWQFEPPDSSDGASAVGNYDDDESPEVVFVSQNGTIYLLDGVGASGTLVMLDSLTFGYYHEPSVAFPALGQLDSDGQPEVAEINGASLLAFDFDTTTGQWDTMWAIDVHDGTPSRSGPSMADLDGDGYGEIIYADEETLWVVDHAGNVIWQTPMSSGTGQNYATIADIDGDNKMEFVIAGSDLGTSRGVSAFGCDSWVDGRRVWNDFTYHVTNINEDGSIPAHQDKCWLTDNSFLAQENRCVLCDKEFHDDWTIEVLKSGTCGPYNAIALREKTFPHIGFRDDSVGGLWYAFKDTIPRGECDVYPEWTITQVDTGGAGCWASIDILSGGVRGELSYANSTNWDARWAGVSAGDTIDCDPAWTLTTLDAGGNLGNYGTDIALDTTGTAPYCGVVYYDASNTNLKYAERQDDHWTVTTIDTAGDVGRYPAIAIDRYRKRHVSYYDATNGELKYASCQSGCSLAVNWSSERVDTTLRARVGLFTEIAVNEIRDVYISYIDSTNRALKCAITGNPWGIVTVESSANDLIASTSIGVFGIKDTVHVSYSDRTAKTLKCASCYGNCDDAANWDELTIPDSWSDVGLWNSIEVGRGDTVHISYSASDSVCDFKALKYVAGRP